MISVVEDVHEVAVEWVHILNLGELCENSSKLLGKVGLSEFDLSHVKCADSRYLVLLVDLGGEKNALQLVLIPSKFDKSLMY